MGSFVVLEGLDGAGTTTQAARLTERLEAAGHVVLRTAEPTGGPIGRLLRTTLQGGDGAADRASLPWLFAADRADHLARTVEPALAAGRWVVSDRYVPSSLAYQSLDRPLDLVDGLNRWFRLPDLTVFVHAPVEVCLARIAARGEAVELFEERETLTRIAAAYEVVLPLLEARGARVARVDGTRSVDEVAARIWQVVTAP
ncbi:MAG: dTMP kinase [Alphaproteobacteria bacterium]|nr:dTMP kinase [Alphaproteobacteria bacterium]